MDTARQIAQAITEHEERLHAGKIVKRKVRQYTPEFEVFWRIWPGRWIAEQGYYKKCGKYNALLVWLALPVEDQRKAVLAAKKLKDNKFTPDAERWLRDRKFDDF